MAFCLNTRILMGQKHKQTIGVNIKQRNGNIEDMNAIGDKKDMDVSV